MQYLDGLEKTDSYGAFHQKLVVLYAKYDRSKLLPFLRRSNDYVMQEALAICKREGFHPEMVYLLGRMVVCKIRCGRTTRIQQGLHKDPIKGGTGGI